LKITLEKIPEFKKLMFVRTDEKGKRYILDYACGIRDMRSEIKRNGKKINTKDFGYFLGSSFRTVESWEGGHREPSRATLLLMKYLMDKGWIKP